MATRIDRADVLGFRVRAQQLDRDTGRVADTVVLDAGAQDSGTDGGAWALANRGVDVPALAGDELATLWTIRGAPHLYRREDLNKVAAAVAPFSDRDAGKRIYSAAAPLKAAGIGSLTALDEVAAAMRSVVSVPMPKGEVSARVTQLLPEPYLRDCRACGAVHVYEMLFRLGALRGGLELQAGTSPPVLAHIAGFKPARRVDPRVDVIRGYLRLLGPATPRLVAGYLDAPTRDVKARWPEDAVPVELDGETRWLLAGDEHQLGPPPPVTRLLGAFDLYLQGKDRDTLIDDAAYAKELWPVLGRPGAVLSDGEIVGSWRPRKSGARLSLAILSWRAPSKALRAAVSEQAERLAAFRGATLAEVTWATG